MQKLPGSAPGRAGKTPHHTLDCSCQSEEIILNLKGQSSEQKADSQVQEEDDRVLPCSGTVLAITN